MSFQSLLSLLQLVSPVLPVGAYSYSEGLETLVEQGVIQDAKTLQDWLINELSHGSIRVETALMIRGYRSFLEQDLEQLNDWNRWLSANRETKELRQQSWQMGQSFLYLLKALNPELNSTIKQIHLPCNYAIAFSLGVYAWQVNLTESVMGYLWSWQTNLVNAGVKLIPLGQTAGQQILFDLNPHLIEIAPAILTLKDEDLSSCSWGLALASMAHETQYSRLFRS